MYLSQLFCIVIFLILQFLKELKYLKSSEYYKYYVTVVHTNNVNISRRFHLWICLVVIRQCQETIVNITMLKCFYLTGIPPHLSFLHKCIHTQGNLFAQSSPSIPSQTKYQKLRIIHSFVHGSLLKEGRSDVKAKHWYFLLPTGNLNHEVILVVIMADANGNSVTIIAFVRVRGSLKFLVKKTLDLSPKLLLYKFDKAAESFATL